MKTLFKAVPCVLKDLDTDPKILCFFEYPHVDLFQIPKGTVEANEAIEKAVLRELEEETGLYNVEIVSKIGSLERVCPGGRRQELEDELQIWHLFHINSINILKDTWEHIGTGDGIDKGIRVKCFWHSLRNDKVENYDQVFIRSFNLIKSFLKK